MFFIDKQGRLMVEPYSNPKHHPMKVTFYGDSIFFNKDRSILARSTVDKETPFLFFYDRDMKPQFRLPGHLAEFLDNGFIKIIYYRINRANKTDELVYYANSKGEIFGIE